MVSGLLSFRTFEERALRNFKKRAPGPQSCYVSIYDGCLKGFENFDKEVLAEFSRVKEPGSLFFQNMVSGLSRFGSLGY